MDAADESSNEGPLDDAAADEALERGRWLFAQTCTFLVSAAAPDQIPAANLPETAFAGRSNVGKSSLVNGLTGRKTLARTSNTPGRTRLLNFFRLAEHLLLVDLPGYGYARASKSDIKQWTGLTRAYLKGRPNLRRVCLLVDARHGLKPGDEAVMKLLDEAAVSYQVVLTKADKASAGTLARTREATAGRLAERPAAHPEILVTSARSGLGIEALRAALAALAHPEAAQ
ncbi:MAG: ribosome biogenesis GTP-binding protein YihA/YsxC [Kiloniellales bacterium]